TALVIGGASWYNGEDTNGLVDGFSYYNTALGARAIPALAQQASGTRGVKLNNGVAASSPGLAISDGRAEAGGGGYNAGTLTLTNDAFTNDVAQGYTAAGTADAGLGGALYNAAGGALVVTGSTFDVNSAIGGVALGTGYGGAGRAGALYN